jgi:hypothetical protein
VKAKDEAGNLSEATNEVTVTTSSKSAYSSSSGNYIIINSLNWTAPADSMDVYNVL